MKFSYIHSPAALPPVPIDKEGWAPGPVCTVCKTVNLQMKSEPYSLVTVSSELHMWIFTKCRSECEIKGS